MRIPWTLICLLWYILVKAHDELFLIVRRMPAAPSRRTSENAEPDRPANLFDSPLGLSDLSSAAAKEQVSAGCFDLQTMPDAAWNQRRRVFCDENGSARFAAIFVGTEILGQVIGPLEPGPAP